MNSLENKIKSLIDKNILHLPQLSEEEQREFKRIKLPDDLEELDCNFRELKELPTLPRLKKLDCGRNQLKKLPTLPDSLEVLICDDNYYEFHNQTTGRVQFIHTLSTLPKLPRLKVLICNANNIYHIPPLPDSLEELNCSGNPNEHLPLLPKSLKKFECYNQQLKEPYASFVRMGNMKDRINSIRLYQLADMGSKLDQLDRFSSLPDDIKTSISTVISGEFKSLPYIREFINNEISNLIDKLGNKTHKVIRLLEKMKHNNKIKQNNETIINSYYNANNSGSPKSKTRRSKTRQTRQSKSRSKSRKK